MGIYKEKKSPYWQYDFTVAGVRYRGSTETDSKKQAADIHAALRAKAVKGIHYDNKETLTLEQAIVKYELNHGQFLKSYGNTIRFHHDNLMRSLGKNTPFESIGQERLETCIASWRTEEYKRGQDKNTRIASAATINRRIAQFRKIHRTATESWNVNTKHINFGKLRLKEADAPNNPLTKEQAQKLISMAKPHIQRFIIISLFVGWREKEVLSMKAEHLDLTNMIARNKGKSDKPDGKEIAVAITKAFYAYIKANKLDQVVGHLITYRGKPIKRIGGKAWKGLFKAAGIKYRRIHDLRHTFGTWLYQHTKDIKLVQEALNHANISTTMRYAHSNKDDQRKQMDGALLPELRQSKLRRVK